MASDTALLYDATGTAVPVPGPEKPNRNRSSLVPSGVASNRNDRYRDYPSRNLTPPKLVSILREADGGDPTQWIQLLEEMIEKDPKLSSVLQTRYSAVQALPWEITPAELDETATAEEATLAEEIARFCSGALRQTNFKDLVGDMLDAIAKPFAVDRIIWGEDRDGKWVPKRFDRIPSRHIRWAFDSDRLLVFDPTNPRADADGNVGVAFEEYTTVRALSNPRRDHPTRAGLGRVIAWYWHFKTQLVKDMMAWFDRYGMPVRVLKLDDPDFDNEERFNRFRANLAALGTDASAIFTKNVELDLEEAMSGAGQGAEQFISGISYLDKAIAWVMLGHELSSQSSPGPGQLGITVSMEVRQDIVQGDCENLSSTFARDVFTPLVAWNYGWNRLHLLPNLYFDYEPPRDLLVEAKTIQIMAQTFKDDLTFSKQQMREQFGFDEPLEVPGTDPESPDGDELRPSAAPTPGQTGLDPNSIDGELPRTQINSFASRRSRSRRRVPKYSASRQRKVDRLGDKTLEAAASVLEKWKRQLAEMVQTAAENGESLLDLRRRIVAEWPELDVHDLERLLREGKVLARMFGRNV